jgi:hypothetical protein
MHIFIDESGNFTPGDDLSLVGALIVPDSRRDDLFRRYDKLRRGLVLDRGEVKGRFQDAARVARVVDLLVKNGVLYEATAIDVAEHTETELLDPKRRQGEGLTKNLNDEHHPNFIKQVWELRARLEQIPIQLYIQSVGMFELLGRVVMHGTMYFSQRIPRELGAFHWVIDAKDRNRTTNWEDWWSMVMMPALQSQSLTKPLGIFTEGDYSHFEQFSVEATDWEVETFKIKDRRVTAIRPIMTKSFRFSSDAEPGLELVDIVVNATRRALRGNLSSDGWKDIPRIMIHRRQQYIQLVNLHGRPWNASNRPYRAVLRQFQRGGRNMLAPRFLDQ